MAVKLFGKIHFNKESAWEITQAQPHVCIKLKAMFQKIAKTQVAPFTFKHTPEQCADLLWFLWRYPMEISAKDMDRLLDGRNDFDANAQRLEEILLANYDNHEVKLNDGETPRPYQVQAAELHHKTQRLLLGDDIGLGKTLSGILTLLKPNTLPALVVVQTHLTLQWKAEIERFTSLKVHIIKVTTPYRLPPADVYIMKYSCLSGWVDMFKTYYWKSVIFDEVQELRRQDSNKYRAATILSDCVDYCFGLSATPIYNYGDEIYSIMNLIKPGCLGKFDDFIREWGTRRGMNYIIDDPKALGTYMRDNYLFLRRTRSEVGRELPAINKIIHNVGYDDNEVKKLDAMAVQLAIKITTGSFMERGSASRELDIMVRQATGVSKAREVAEYVKILLANGEPIVLAGWHREVYEIWKEHLAEFNPVFYTGSESPTQKEAAKNAFINGETNLFIMSLRSGIGLDGLQKRCKLIVIGELDWSPKVHDQIIGRVDRDGRDVIEPVTAIFLVSEYGSDPAIIDLLGLKSSQSHGIVDPLTAPVANVSDDSRIKLMAEWFLKKQKL